MSDRNAKAGFTPVQADAVLDGLLSLPLSKWHYKFEPPEIQHIGPMAQDFKAAFGVGVDDKHIFQIDADGVSFAAIQALSHKLDTVMEAQRRLERDNADLLARVQQLETEVATARAAASRTH
jgi:hypothetical protein